MPLAPVLRGVFAALLLLAALVDARERRLPNALAAGLAVAGGAVTLVAGGPARLLANLFATLAVCGALLGFELAWRARRGAPGQGMGDLKALGALMLVAPGAALAAYALGLLLLALACMALRRASMPLLPFLAAAFVVVQAGLAVAG